MSTTQGRRVLPSAPAGGSWRRHTASAVSCEESQTGTGGRTDKPVRGRLWIIRGQPLWAIEASDLLARTNRGGSATRGSPSHSRGCRLLPHICGMKRGTPQSFTGGASAVLDAAQDEARALGYGWVSTEHLLLGLIREADGLVAEVLRSLGIGAEGARVQVQNVCGRGIQPPD